MDRVTTNLTKPMAAALVTIEEKKEKKQDSLTLCTWEEAYAVRGVLWAKRQLSVSPLRPPLWFLAWCIGVRLSRFLVDATYISICIGFFALILAIARPRQFLLDLPLSPTIFVYGNVILACSSGCNMWMEVATDEILLLALSIGILWFMSFLVHIDSSTLGQLETSAKLCSELYHSNTAVSTLSKTAKEVMTFAELQWMRASGRLGKWVSTLGMIWFMLALRDAVSSYWLPPILAASVSSILLLTFTSAAYTERFLQWTRLKTALGATDTGMLMTTWMVMWLVLALFRGMMMSLSTTWLVTSLVLGMQRHALSDRFECWMTNARKLYVSAQAAIHCWMQPWDQSFNWFSPTFSTWTLVRTVMSRVRVAWIIGETTWTRMSNTHETDSVPEAVRFDQKMETAKQPLDEKNMSLAPHSYNVAARVVWTIGTRYYVAGNNNDENFDVHRYGFTATDMLTGQRLAYLHSVAPGGVYQHSSWLIHNRLGVIYQYSPEMRTFYIRRLADADAKGDIPILLHVIPDRLYCEFQVCDNYLVSIVDEPVPVGTKLALKMIEIDTRPGVNQGTFIRERNIHVPCQTLCEPYFRLQSDCLLVIGRQTVTPHTPDALVYRIDLGPTRETKNSSAWEAKGKTDSGQLSLDGPVIPQDSIETKEEKKTSVAVENEPYLIGKLQDFAPLRLPRANQYIFKQSHYCAHTNTFMILACSQRKNSNRRRKKTTQHQSSPQTSVDKLCLTGIEEKRSDQGMTSTEKEEQDVRVDKCQGKVWVVYKIPLSRDTNTVSTDPPLIQPQPLAKALLTAPYAPFSFRVLVSEPALGGDLGQLIENKWSPFSCFGFNSTVDGYKLGWFGLGESSHANELSVVPVPSSRFTFVPMFTANIPAFPMACERGESVMERVRSAILVLPSFPLPSPIVEMILQYTLL